MGTLPQTNRAQNHVGMKKLEEKQIHRLFEISVALKGIHALFEIAGGILLYFISTRTIVEWVSALTQDELTEDPNSFLSNYLLNAAQHVTLAGKTFAVLYLLSHGLIKAALVAGLLRNKYWAYPASLVVLWLYVIYQLYRFSVTLSIGMALLTIFDIIVIWLIWHEYKIVKSERGGKITT